MKTTLLLVALLALSQAQWAQTLTQDGLKTELESGKQVWLVYSSKSGGHLQTVESVAKVLKGFFKVGILPQGSNQLALYGDDREKPYIYTGEYDANAIVKFVLSTADQILEQRGKEAEQLKHYQQYLQKQTERANKQWKEEQELRKKSDTLLLTNQNWESFTKAREPFLINFYESNCSHCIELNKEWQLLSTELKGKVRVAKINMTEDQNHHLEEQIRLSRYPSIRFYPQGPKKIEQFSLFQGVHKKFSILEWLNARLKDKAQKADIPIFNAANYQSLCRSTKNTCIVVFLDDSEPGDNLKSIEALAIKHIKKPITFLVSKKGQQEAFANQAGVESYPDTVMVYCKLKKIWRMGEFNVQNVEDAINEISLGNRNNFVRLSFTEQIK